MKEIHDQSTRVRWIPGWERQYLATFYGDIISVSTKKHKRPNRGHCIYKSKILKPAKNRCGYLIVVLSKNAIAKTFTVHFLTALAFIGERPNGLVINHIDGCKTNNLANNLANNLEYITNRENIVLGIDKTKTSSQYYGVYFDKRMSHKKNPWLAYVTINNKKKHLGCFKTELEKPVVLFHNNQ